MLRHSRIPNLDQSAIEQNSIPVTESGCWIWLRSVGTRGYGNLRRARKFGTLRAHKISYEIFKGDIPAGMHVLHSCDERLCVNPAHLSVGTNYENILDSMKKGRRKGVVRSRPSGLIYQRPTEETKDRKRKIRNSQLPEILDLRKQGVSLNKIGAIYNVSGVTIFNAVKRAHQEKVV